MTALTAEPVSPVEQNGALFALRGLTVDFLTPHGPVRAIDGVDLALRPGETLGLVGESGSGKTVGTLAPLGLLPGRTPVRVGGTAEFDGTDLLGLSPRERREMLGRDIGVVFQDPISALDPVQQVGDQIAETLRLRDRRLSQRAARSRAIDLLRAVGVPDPAGRIRAYPHEFSGGMCQRVVIAIAMANRPRLVIADEPTTAVDATVQAQLMELLAQLQAESGSAILLITHDLALVAQTADRICLMYAGKVVESAPTTSFVHHPAHPYGIGLLAGRADATERRRRLPVIPGRIPDLTAMPPGCRFEPRCFRGSGDALCQQAVPQARIVDDHTVACHYPGSEPAPTVTDQPVAAPTQPSGDESTPRTALLEVRGLAKEFPIRSTALRRRIGQVQAVDGIDLDLAAGETLALVGESGCGKSTTGRLILRLLDPTGGTVRVAGHDIASLSSSELRHARTTMQMVFQDPLGSLNPRLTAAENIADPLRAMGMPKPERHARIAELLAEVGLHPGHATRLPTEFSGGQRQRIGIARALSVRPSLVVLDEPVASLDVSVQAQIINLLMALQETYRTGYVFISHDLSVVRHISDRTAVMYLGRIVETGPTAAIFDDPQHPYTQALISAAPALGAARERIVLPGEPPSATSLPTGCRFRTRCVRATAICGELEPPLARVGTGAITVACHHPGAADLDRVRS